MGCGNSKAQPEELPEIDFSGLDKFCKFEHSFNLYRIRIDTFEGKVKRFVTGKNSVTLQQLRYAFKDDQKMADLQDDNSLLCQIVKSDYFKDEKNDEEINIHSLILWGLTLCSGDPLLKARVFYDVLQDSLQETISASDKDFKESFDKLINNATKLAYQYEPEFSGGDKNKDANAKVTEELLEKLSEDFIDEIFGANAKMPRKDYINAVAGPKLNWIFSSKAIREKVEKTTV
jgi:hypothetical protein